MNIEESCRKKESKKVDFELYDRTERPLVSGPRARPPEAMGRPGPNRGDLPHTWPETKRGGLACILFWGEPP
jgi:hypothetical protein